MEKKINIIKPFPGTQEQFLSCGSDIVIYGGSAGGGKALALDTPVLCFVDGKLVFKTMGTLEIGDTLFDEKGRPCKVTETYDVMFNRHCYSVKFTSGEKIVADGEHLWGVSCYTDRKKYYENNYEKLPPFRVLTTKEMLPRLYAEDERTSNYAVLNVKVLILPDNGIFSPFYNYDFKKYTRLSEYDYFNHILAIEPVPSVPVRCISVDSPSRLFLVGRTLIPTHNSYALLLDPLRYVNLPGFYGVIFRRSSKDITNAGSLWHKAMEIYAPLGAIPNKQSLSFTFPRYEKMKNGNFKAIPGGGGMIQLSHMYELDDRFNWQGAELAYIGFDEMTHFEYCQFEYMLTRNRNTLGIPNLIRGTCNPDPDSFLRKMLDLYLDKETGYPIPEVCGKEFYLVIEDGEFLFSDTKEALLKDNPNRLPKTFTFIPSKITDNPFLKNDVSYLSSLNALNEFERHQLLDGCWNERPLTTKMFLKEWFPIVDIPQLPKMKRKVRGWDLAASKDKELAKKEQFDYTASVKLEEGYDGYIYITDMTNEQLEPAGVNNKLRSCAEQDGLTTVVRIPQDPGSAGKHLAYEISMKLLRDYIVHYRTMRSDKVSRAQLISDKASKGLFRVLRGAWNGEFFKHLERFPPKTGSPNIVDAFVEAYIELHEADSCTLQGPVIV